MTPLQRALAPALVALAACGPADGRTPAAAPAAPLPAGFWDTWGDGLAELNGYRLRTPRYGHARDGYAVQVFVTETFTNKTRVKSDGGHDDEFPVLKLNDIRRFQTGIYDYGLMTSVFTPLDGRLAAAVPTKIAFSSQEWCGVMFDQILVDPGTFRRSTRSYFDGEADTDEKRPLPAGTLFADTLPIAVRGITGPALGAGAVQEVTVLPTLATVRLAHTDFESAAGTVGRDETIRSRTVPAGTFDVRATTFALRNGPSTTWEVEVAPPHRIIAWSTSDGETAELMGSTRRAYWKDNGPGGEQFLADLGLAPLAPSPAPSPPAAAPAAPASAPPPAGAP